MYKHKFLQRKVAAALAAGTLLLSSPAFAAEDTGFQFDQITITADRISQTLAETPENVTVISNQDIQDKGAKTLADALTGISGVIVSSYGGIGDKAIPYILGSDRVVVMIDGKRMNLPQGIGSGRGGIDLNSYLISSDTIERIEVVKGGASVLYGSDAVGGVINIITKKGEGTTHVNTSIAAGNYGGRSYEISASGQENKTHWQFSGLQESTDGQRSVNSDSKNKNFSLRIDQDLSKNEGLTLTYDYYGNHAGMPGYITNTADYSSATDYQDILRHNWSIAYNKQHSDGNSTIRYYENDQLYTGKNDDPAFSDPYFRHQNIVKAFEYQDSNKISNNQVLTWGGEWHKDKVSSTKSVGNTHENTTKALYLQDQIGIAAKDTLTIGLRYDDNDLYGNHWLPKVAYLHQATKDTSYFANWNKVFKAPNFDDLYGDYGWGMTGNPNLKAETGWTAEFGVKTKMSKVTEASLSIFKREISDAINWAMGSNGEYHPYNVDQLTTSGVNASLISKLSKATSLDIGYTYLSSHDQNNTWNGDPHHSFHLGLNIHDNKISQSVYGIFRDKGKNISSSFIVNTNTSYSIDKNTSLFLKVNNLFNKQYRSFDSYYNYPANSRNFLFGVKYSM